MSEAIVEIEEAKLNSKLKTLWLKAISAVELQNHSYAISLCHAVLKEAPGFVEARRLARRCSVQVNGGAKKGGGITQIISGSFSFSKIQGQAKKDPIGALFAIEKELAKDPNSDQLNELLFDTAIRLNLQETATMALETVRRGGNGNTSLLHKLASYYLARNIPDKAAEVYKDIIKLDPADIDAVKGEKDAEARHSMQKDNWSEDASLDDVTKDNEEAKELDNSDRAGMTKDQLKDKRDRLLASYQQDQNNLNVVKQIARVYEDLEYWPESYNFYSWAYQISNQDVTLKNKSEQMRTKASDEVIKSLEAQLVADPGNQELKQELSSLKADRSKEAVSEAQASVDRNPTDPQLRFDLGLALYNSGDFNGAIPHLQQAKRNPHIRTRVLLTLGRSFDSKGMHDIGLNQFKEALEDLHGMDGTKKEVLYEMGLIYTKMENRQDALECFKQIYEVDYGYLDVAKRVEESYGG